MEEEEIILIEENIEIKFYKYYYFLINNII